MAKTITGQWAEFLAWLSYDDIPPEVVKQTRLFILDCIGCALGGYAIEWGKRVAALGRDLGGNPEATAIGSGDKLHCASAAYVNGKLANLLDMDETLYNNRHIGGVPLFPALSIGERMKASGKNIILSTVLGYDFAARSGLCGSAFRPDKEKGVAVSGNAAMGFNTFGAAVAAGKAFQFSTDQMINTLGIAAYLAPGAIESKFCFTPPGNINKYGDMGWFCQSGVMAALCVLNGYIGDPSVLDGPRGISAVLGAPEFDNETFVADLGKRWYIMDAGFKPYPDCRWFHTGIKLLKGIIKEHSLKPGDIEKIVIRTHPLAVDMPTFAAGANWAESGKELWLSVDSATYVMACTALGIAPGPEWAKEATLTSPEVVEMSRKVIHAGHPEAVKQTSERTGHPGRIFSQPPSSIEVVSRKGKFFAESTDVPGDSWNPNSRLTDSEIIGKFKTNALSVLDEARVDRIVQTVERLDELGDIRKLTELLSP